MDKLKYIKLENEDGSYSNSIPLAVDSDYVDVNGNTLTSELINKANSSDLNLLTSRVDNLAHLEEGSTTGDAELIDTRVNHHGLLYNSAGDSIRITEKDLENTYNENYNWAIGKHETGGYNSSTGEPVTGNTMVRTKKVQILPHCDYLTIHLKSAEHCKNDAIQVQLWEENGTYVSCVTLGGASNLASIYQPYLWAKPGEWIALAYPANDSNEAALDIENENIEIYQKSLKENDELINLIYNGTVSNYVSYGGTTSSEVPYRSRWDLAMNPSYPQCLIKVKPGEKYYGSWGAINITLDKNKNFIKGYSASDRIVPSGQTIWTVPDGVYYLMHDYMASASNKMLTKYINGTQPIYTEAQAGTKDGYMPSINLLPGEEYIRSKDLDNTIENLGYIKNDSSLQGKKINLVGDSITSTDYERPYWGEIISARTGCTVNNYGISGTTLAHTHDRHLWDYHFGRLDAEEIGYVENDPSTWSTGNCFCERFTKIDNSADAIVVMGGTNDGSVKMGDWNSTDTSTFYGALNILIPGLLNNFPGKPILFCTMMQNKTSYSSNVIDPLATLQTKSSTNTLSLQLRAEAIKAKCKQYGMACLDLFNESGINGVDNNGAYFRNNDTLHPSAYGQLRLANLIQNKLEELLQDAPNS